MHFNDPLSLSTNSMDEILDALIVYTFEIGSLTR